MPHTHTWSAPAQVFSGQEWMPDSHMENTCICRAIGFGLVTWFVMRSSLNPDGGPAPMNHQPRFLIFLTYIHASPRIGADKLCIHPDPSKSTSLFYERRYPLSWSITLPGNASAYRMPNRGLGTRRKSDAWSLETEVSKERSVKEASMRCPPPFKFPKRPPLARGTLSELRRKLRAFASSHSCLGRCEPSDPGSTSA
ncbi:hypothetical protein LZ30DRAFT_47547 [Colletotrichum cereale]|nr:hypothetical protein LZ30DRAFT_47547 [Colletotrichum cereale]